MKYVIPIALLFFTAACGDKLASGVATEEVKTAAQEQQVRGFVFSDWAYDIPKEDPGDCPDGLNITDEEFFSEEYAAAREEVKKRWEAGDRDGALEPTFPHLGHLGLWDGGDARRRGAHAHASDRRLFPRDR